MGNHLKEIKNYDKEGRPHGYWETYFKDNKRKKNKLRSCGSYNNGLKNGLWKMYYTNSTLRYSGEFKNGKPDGIHKLYSIDGYLNTERLYNLGAIVKIIKYKLPANRFHKLLKLYVKK